MPGSDSAIRVVGARVHNLRNLDVEIPLQALTVITGVSGSGKSSLAFDTLYAEGQRRYVESLSAYARQFLERMEKPDVDAIEGITPAVAIRQKASTRNPRSTVGTATEIFDYLRLLFARVGRIVCPHCGITVERNSVDAVVAQLLRAAEGRRAYVLFPVTADEGAAAPPVERLAELRARGFNRLYQDGRMVEFSAPETLLDLDFTRPVYVLADRLVLELEGRGRLVDAIETAYREAAEVRFEFPPEEPGGAVPAALRFHERLACTRCGREFVLPEPSLFSFNNPYGACPRCHGFGNTSDFDPDRIVPNPSLTLAEGAIEPFNRPRALRWRRALDKFAQARGIPRDVPWRALAADDRQRILEGAPGFPGVRGYFQRLERKKYKVHVRVLLARYRGYSRCPDCQGSRLRPEALCVYLDGPGGLRNIGDVVALSVDEAAAFLAALQLSPMATQIAGAVLAELRRRVGFLLQVGLGYITLDRLTATLSGGEAQRIQLATCLGAQLVGSLYVLDEPSIGLHPRDTRRLIDILYALRDLGNTIVVVEHDAEMMAAADRLLDLGPRAGELGGQLVAAGTFEQVRSHAQSLTGRYLRGEMAVPAGRRRAPGRARLLVEGAYAHNLKDIDVEIPLGLLVAITGVSGSGKSTLVHDVLYRNLQVALQGAPPATAEDEMPAAGLGRGCRRVRGAEELSEVLLVDQSPIGRTPRSNPVTYLKAFDRIRELYAAQPLARRRGYTAGHFSFNRPGGRCEACQGDGVVTVAMQFLADVELSCEECGGTRYQSATLEVTWQDRNIHDVLQLTVSEALAFFASLPRVTQPLRILEEIGLGYLRLGQSATTLSGGEAQRLKLAARLAQSQSAKRTLFLFDEPTTGLHFDDISKLLAAFDRLLEAGGSIIVIEHNLEVIAAADWLIELGPEGGPEGGRLVGAGPPEAIAALADSQTAPFLARRLGFERATPAPVRRARKTARKGGQHRAPSAS